MAQMIHDKRPPHTEFVSCNGFGCSPVQIVLALFRLQSKLHEWFESTDREVVFTYQARYALGLICRLLPIGPGDEVLVPAYNCGAEIDPYVKAGAKIVLYRVDSALKLDLEDVMHRTTRSTRIVHVTHYFGWPQEIKALAEWCRKKEIFLVEDCAQALFSQGPGNSIGQTGDAAVYSFVKSLPVPDGAALLIRKGLYPKTGKLLKSPNPSKVFRNCLPLIKKWFMGRNLTWQRYNFTRRLLTKSWLGQDTAHGTQDRPKMLKSNYFDISKADWSISRLSKGFLSKVDRRKVVQKRSANYEFLYKSLRNIQGVEMVPGQLFKNVSPLSFPFLVEDRDTWYKALSDKGILVLGWPGYYPGLNWEEFPEACRLKDNLITLPVHQELDAYHMDYIAECVRSVSEKSLYVQANRVTWQL